MKMTTEKSETLNGNRMKNFKNKIKDHLGIEYEGKETHLRGPNSLLYNAICPMIYVIRVFGLAPYTFSKDLLVPSNLNSIFTIVWFLVYTFILVEFLLRNTEKRRLVLTITENGKLILNYCVIISDIFVTIFKRDQFVEVWNAIQDFDVSTAKLGYPRSEKAAKTWVWTTLVISFVTWVVINQLGVFAFNEPYFQNFCYLISYIGSCVSLVKFSGIVLLLGQRFRYLNIIADQFGKVISDFQNALPDENIKKIENIYNELLATSENLNVLYFWSLMLYLLNLGAHSVSNMYIFTVRTIRNSDQYPKGTVGSCLAIWLLAYLAQLILIHTACHFTTDEANRTAYILLNWRRWLTQRTNKKIDGPEVTLHMANRRLAFTAAGCFDVNLRQLTSTAGLLTTYLVILLQLPESDSS